MATSGKLSPLMALLQKAEVQAEGHRCRRCKAPVDVDDPRWRITQCGWEHRCTDTASNVARLYSPSEPIR